MLVFFACRGILVMLFSILTVHSDLRFLYWHLSLGSTGCPLKLSNNLPFYYLAFQNK